MSVEQPPRSPTAPPSDLGPPLRAGLFINRNFVLLTAGQAVSNLGDTIYNTTLLIWVFTLTHSAAAVSGVLVAYYAPIFVFGPVAGVFADRWNRRYTMIGADLARACAMMLPFIVPGELRLPAIYASVVGFAGFSRLFMPAKSGLLQVIVPQRAQTQAASITQTMFAASFVLGPAIAAPLYFAVGPFFACLLNALSYLVSATTLLFIRATRESLHPYAFATDRGGGVRAVARELAGGFGYVIKTRILLMTTIFALLGMFGAGAINALDVVFVSQRLHTDLSLYGVLTAAAGIGVLIGAIGAGLVARKITPQHLMTGSVVLTGLAIFAYSFQTRYVVALVVNFLLALPQGGIDVGYGPILLNNTPKRLMGRVQSVIETVMFGTSLLSSAVAGSLGQFVPVNVVFAASGVILFVAGVFGWFTIPGPKAAEAP